MVVDEQADDGETEEFIDKNVGVVLVVRGLV